MSMRAIAALLLLSLPAGVALAQPTNNPERRCEGDGRPAAQIVADCTHFLQGLRLSDRQRAVLLVTRANAWMTDRKTDYAIQDYTAAAKLDPKSPSPYRNRGVAWRANRDYARAIADFDKALSLDPSHAETYGHRGLAYRESGEYDRAIADFSEAMRLQPGNSIFPHSRGITWHLKRDLDRAIADFTSAIALSPGHVDALMARGAALSEKNDLAASIADFSQAIRIRPDLAQAYNNRGAMRYRRGEVELALADYGEAMRLDPRDPAPFANRGNAEFLRGNFARAANDLGRAAMLNPASVDAALWAHLARARAGNNDIARLRQQAVLLDLANWPGPAIRLFLGELSVDEVVRLARTSPAAQVSANVCGANFYVAQFRLVGGNTGEGQAGLRDAMRSCPPGSSGYEAAAAELRRTGKGPAPQR